MRLLSKSYKKAFSFRVAAPSFIYPDQYLPNVERLGPYLDEIELLFFESDPQPGLPSPAEIEALAAATHALDVGYHLHLPIDINLGHPIAANRQKALDGIERLLKLTRPLMPTAYILHLPFEGYERTQSQIDRWRQHLFKAMEEIVKFTGGGLPIAIETLDYPMEWIDPLLEHFQLNVCVDIGHLLCHGFDVAATLDRYTRKISIIHLQGADGRKDHLPLDCLSLPVFNCILDFLPAFQGILTFEVFAFDPLESSLKLFEERWRKFQSLTKESGLNG